MSITHAANANSDKLYHSACHTKTQTGSGTQKRKHSRCFNSVYNFRLLDVPMWPVLHRTLLLQIKHKVIWVINVFNAMRWHLVLVRHEKTWSIQLNVIQLTTMIATFPWKIPIHLLTNDRIEATQDRSSGHPLSFIHQLTNPITASIRWVPMKTHTQCPNTKLFPDPHGSCDIGNNYS